MDPTGGGKIGTKQGGPLGGCAREECLGDFGRDRIGKRSDLTFAERQQRRRKTEEE